ncbi:hypothetical protein EJ06DRAFT_551653 [Trichodelitschia bisporula]|uniref:Uncharacterized protein n=1 Tax=Trichodelitschia bisporula TaxID=703511 RepID=A0A6G1HKX9_9PEZI|nr:hypothetical protein EJ06DRAFT_551653 [Trichodelitschia bisporula]
MATTQPPNTAIPSPLPFKTFLIKPCPGPYLSPWAKTDVESVSPRSVPYSTPKSSQNLESYLRAERKAWDNLGKFGKGPSEAVQSVVMKLKEAEGEEKVEWLLVGVEVE